MWVIKFSLLGSHLAGNENISFDELFSLNDAGYNCFCDCNELLNLFQAFTLLVYLGWKLLFLVCRLFRFSYLFRSLHEVLRLTHRRTLLAFFCDKVLDLGHDITNWVLACVLLSKGYILQFLLWLSLHQQLQILLQHLLFCFKVHEISLFLKDLWLFYSLDFLLYKFEYVFDSVCDSLPLYIFYAFLSR